MAIVTALFSYLSRQLASILRALFGWSITGLFGRQPAAKQTALSVVLGLAIAWPILLVGVFWPGVASWALAFVPLHHWLGPWETRVLWIVLAAFVPAGVGAIARWVAKDGAAKGGPFRTIIQGYPLTLGLVLAFLVTLIVVPTLKLAAIVRGWADEHVYLQIRKDAYEQVLATLRDACDAAGVRVDEKPVPWPTRLPTKIVQWFSRGAIEPIVASDPRMLRGQELEIYLYPGDLLLRGQKTSAAALRAALLRQPLSLYAYLSEDARGQRVEDELRRMWQVAEEHRGRAPAGVFARERVTEIARELDALHLPFEQWLLLYTNLHLLERALAGGPRLVDAPAQTDGTTEAPMPQAESTHQDESATTLIGAALKESRDLIKSEVALARTEALQEFARLKTAGMALGAAAALGIVGITLLLVAAALACGLGWLAPLVFGIVTVVLAAGVALFGRQAAPKELLKPTIRRVETDVQLMKEHMP
ncbi:MAG TPA: phage holin family protein [Polyangiaceae bacterium]